MRGRRLTGSSSQTSCVCVSSSADGGGGGQVESARVMAPGHPQSKQSQRPQESVL